MKKSVFGMIIPAVLAIGLAGCPTEGPGEETISPATVTGAITGSVFNKDGSANNDDLTAAFTYIGYDDEHPISGCTTGFAINNGTITFTLETPPSGWLESLSEMSSAGLSVSNSAASVFIFGYFSNSNRDDWFEDNLYLEKDEDHRASYWYVDRDVTIKGTLQGRDDDDEDALPYKYVYNLNLEKGWNSVLSGYSLSESTETGTIESGKPDSSYKWVYYH
ncbi:hypothetical protein AGMMS49928_29450 [Spirochaetia bacterium]|nr:hypothetical protein AGMMS49928_29450 [Spirochaetia bacterium]